MPPRVRNAINEASQKWGVPVHDIIGPRHRRYRKATLAKMDIIAALYDPATSGNYTSDNNIGRLSAIARYMQIDRTTVLHHARKMGLRP